MRREIQYYLANRPDLLTFVRENPFWYRILTRNPEKVYEIEEEAKIFYGRTFPQRIDRFKEQLDLVHMLFSLFQVMGNDNQS